MYRYLLLLLLLTPFIAQTQTSRMPCNNDPPPQETANEVMPLCDGLDPLNEYCLTLADAVNCTPTNGNFPGCNPAQFILNNPNWFGFIAGSTIVGLRLDITNCANAQGAQFALYEATGEIGPDPECNPANLPLSVVMDGGLPQCDCVTGLQIYDGIATTIGATYYLVFDGCNGDICDIFITVDAGGEAPEVDEPVDIIFPDSGFEPPIGGQLDTVCAGAQQYPVTSPDIFGAGSYIWTVDGGAPFLTFEPFALYDFPNNPGQEFEFCVQGRSDCDTSNTVYCESVVLAPLDTVFLAPINLCEGETTTMGGIQIGPYENLTADFVDNLAEMAVDATYFNCGYIAVVQVFVQNENDENPIVIDTVICGEPPITILGNVFSGSVSNMEIEETGAAANGCDLYYDVSVDFIFADISYDPNDVVCTNGSLMLCPQSENYLPPLGSPGLAITYVWTRDSDGMVVSNGQRCLNISLGDFNNDIESFSLNVTMTVDGMPSPACSYGPFDVELNLEDLLPAEGMIDGPSEVCVGSIGTYLFSTADTDDPNPTWIHTHANAAVLTQDLTMYTLEFNQPGIGIICVTPTNGCGSADSTCITVNVVNAPDAGADGFSCDLNYNLAAGTATGFWFVVDSPSAASNAMFSNGIDPNAVVTVDEGGSWIFGWSLNTDDCFDQVNVVFLDSIELDGAEMNLCDNTNTNYTKTFNVTGGLTPYTVVSGNGSMTGNMFTSDPIPADQSFTVIIEDAAGCQREFTFGPFGCSCETDAATMTDTTLLESCGIDSCYTALANYADTMMDGNDIAEYILHTSPGAVDPANVIARNTTGRFCFLPGMMLDLTYYISLVIGDDLGSGAVDLTESCTRTAPGQPVIWHEIPNASAVDNLSTCADSIQLNATRSVGLGTWYFASGPGAAAFSSVNSPNSRVSVSSCGIYEFIWVEDNSGCVDTASITAEFYCNPQVGGVFTACNGTQDSINLVINIVNGQLPYTEDDGRGSIVGNDFSLNGLPLNTPDTFNFTDANGCRLSVPVPIGDCSCITAAGAMGSTLVNVCQDGSIIMDYDNTDRVFDANDTVQFIVHTLPDTILGDIVATSLTPDFSFGDGPFACDSTYYVSAVAGNWTGSMVDLLDPCVRITAGQPFRFDCLVTADAGPDTIICAVSVDLTGFSSSGIGVWTALSAGTNVTTINDSMATANVPRPGTYTFEFTGVNGACTASDQMTVRLVGAPTIDQASVMHICNAANDSFQVIFEFGGGEPPYFSSGTTTGTIVGNTFTSNFLPSGSVYTLRIYDVNDCDRDATINSFTCACITQTGTMAAGDVHLCEDENFDVTAFYDDASENPDGDDVRNYILSDNQADPTSNIIVANTTGLFTFDDITQDLGTTYYVAVILGDPSSPSTVDLSDVCLSTSSTVSITWHNRIDMFEIDPSGLEITCQDPQVTLGILTAEDLTGYDIRWTTSNGNIEPGDETLPTARVNTEGTYTLTISHPQAGCDESRMITITQSADLPTAMIADPLLLTCVRNEVTISGTGSSAGAEIEYEWNGPGIVGDNTGVDILANAIGVYTIRVLNTSTGCDITANITVGEDRMPPAAAATTNEKIDCDSDRVTVSGAGSLEGMNVTYSWAVLSAMGNIVSGANSRDMVADLPGTYELTVVNLDNGCSATATAIVEQEGNIINSFETTLQHPGCAGTDDGSITVTNIVGGVGPFTYSFDGGQNFTANATAGSFAPGVFQIVVRDVNGCELEGSAILTAPFDFFIDLGADQIVLLGEEVVLTGLTNLPDSLTGSISWNPLFDSTAANSLEQRFTPNAGQYNIVLVVSNSNGCVQQDMVNVFVRFEERVYIPTAMNTKSIANDNRFLNIYADPNSVSSISSFDVYNRWGGRVFSRQDVPVGLTLNSLYAWDGQADGEDAEPGVYTYVVQVEYVTGLTEVLSGTVTLIR